MNNESKDTKYLINELKKYKALLETLKNENLYTSYIDYDWDENPIADYNYFDMEEYIDEWMSEYNQKQKNK